MTRDGDRVALEGPLNLLTVPAVLSFGLESIADGARVFDFAAVTEVDSSALAMAIEWMRAVAATSPPVSTAGLTTAAPGSALQFTNLPAGFVSLAQLYGVTELLRAR